MRTARRLMIVAAVFAGPCVGWPDRLTVGAGYQQDPEDRHDAKVSVNGSLSFPITYNSR